MRAPRGLPRCIARSGPLTLAGASALSLVACVGERPAAHDDAPGTIVIATVGAPQPLVPPLVATLQGMQMMDQLFDRLAEPGDSLNVVGDAGLRPRLARGWRWGPDSLSIAFSLDERARWHDGRPVTSADVRFTHALYRDTAVASAVAPLVADIDSVSAPDPRTAVFHFRRRSPQQFFDATYQMYVVPEHLLATAPRGALGTSAFARHPVGSGRFRFVREVPGQLVEMAADTGNFRRRPGVARVLWTVRSDPNAATRALLAGEADVWEQVRPDMLSQVATAADLRPVAYPSLDVGFVAFNLGAGGAATRRPTLLADRALRRALAAAVDRASAARNVFDTLAFADVAPVPRALTGWTPAATGPRFDADSARAALDALGWRDADGDGVRERAGRPLAFTLLVPSTSSARMRYAVLLQAQWKAVGARVAVEPADLARFQSRVAAGDFDAALLATHADPAPASLLQQWGAPGAGGRGAANVGGYRSAAFEALMDSAGAAFEGARARTLYERAFTLLADDAPAIWLYEPRNVAGVHRRLEPAVLRADGWWSGLADWRVRPGAALARDRASSVTSTAAR